MILETFFHSGTSSITKAQVKLCPNLEAIDLLDSADELSLLKHAIEWAIVNESDVIVILGGTFLPLSLDFGDVITNILKLHEYEVYAFALNSSLVLDNTLQIDNGLFLSEGWTSEESWIILRPLFSIIQDDFDQLQSRFVSIKDLLNFLVHTKFTFSPPSLYRQEESMINLIIPFRNVEKYIVECIRSIEDQKYLNYRIFFIDDVSSDGTSEKIPLRDNYRLIRNEERKFALYNIVQILVGQMFNDDDIICLIDGDDKLSHSYVLKVLSNIYSAGDIDLTYGSFRHIGGVRCVGFEYSKDDFRSLRQVPWKASHLKTFKFRLFKKLLDIDPDLLSLKDHKGNFITMPYDMALMFPLMEISGLNRSRFINSPLYLYREHSDNDHIKNRELQLVGEEIVRNKPRLPISL